jgi:hypothetical protein
MNDVTLLSRGILGVGKRQLNTIGQFGDAPGVERLGRTFSTPKWKSPRPAGTGCVLVFGTSFETFFNLELPLEAKTPSVRASQST